jgi:hypothetical protein
MGWRTEVKQREFGVQSSELAPRTSMSLLVLLFLLLLGNWLLTAILVVIPLNLLDSLGGILWFCCGAILLLLFSWFFGD